MPTKRQLYEQELANHREDFEQIDFARERGYLMKSLVFSANVENIIPRIPREVHEYMFRALLLQNIFASFDQNCLTAGELLDVNNVDVSRLATDGPRIYCTYHLGSFRLLAPFLFRHGVDCVVILGNNLIKSQQGAGIVQLFDEIRKLHQLTNTFKIIDAGSSSAGLSMLRELKAGNSLVVYVDGSAETGPQPGEETQFIPVRLGAATVLARKGVAYLAHATGIPLVPVLSYRKTDDMNVLQFMEPILPDKKVDREEFCRIAMQQLYDDFWPYLNAYADQWEGWNYIQDFIQPMTVDTALIDTDKNKYSFNESRYTLCDLEKGPMLFDRRTYQLFEITDDLRELLQNVQSMDNIEETLGEEMMTELRELQILH